MLVESETSNSAHLDNQTSGVSLPTSIQEEEKFSRTSLQLILTATTILVAQEFVLTVTVNQKKVPYSSGVPAVTSPDIVALTVNGRTGNFTNVAKRAPTILHSVNTNLIRGSVKPC